MRNVLIAGIGSTTFGRHTEVDIQVLAARAADAIKDSDCRAMRSARCILAISFPVHSRDRSAGWPCRRQSRSSANSMFEDGRGSASGGIAFRHAYLAVASGTCDLHLRSVSKR